MTTFKCPECHEEYTPKHETKQQAKNNNDPIGVEQHKTQVCSRTCFLSYLGSYVENVTELEAQLDQSEIPLYLVIEEVTDTEQTSEFTEIMSGEVKDISEDSIGEAFQFGDRELTRNGLNTLITENTAYVER